MADDAPKRIQLRRTKGWRKPEGAVVVARPSKWGNPYKADEVATRGDVVRLYQQVLLGQRPEWSGDVTVTVDDIRTELRGRDLACWCPLDQPCHADALLQIANAACRSMSDVTAFDAKRFSSIEEQEGWFATLAKTVAVDFDGVLHRYTAGWVGSVPADESPMPGALEFLLRLKNAGYRVVVFSTRCDHEAGLVGTRDWLARWGLAALVDDVSCQKPAAVAYVDDRAVRFRGDWDEVDAGIADLAKGRSHGAATVSGSDAVRNG